MLVANTLMEKLSRALAKYEQYRFENIDEVELINEVSKLLISNTSREEQFINIPDIFDRLLDNKELREKEGTLYINCAGYLWNLYGECLDKWREIRKSINK